MSGLFGSPGGVNKPIVYSSLQVSTSQLNLPIALFWGQRRLGVNAFWFNDFQKHKQSAKGKGGGGKGGGQYTYSAAVLLGLCEGAIDGIANAWSNGSTTNVTTLADLNMTLFTGTASQTAWSWISTRYPTQARSYAYTAYLACPKLDLGAAATVPDLAFEVKRAAGFAYTHSVDGWKNPSTGVVTPAFDVLPSDVIHDLLTNVQYGGYLTSGELGSLSQYAAYCRAQGLFFSPLVSAHVKVTELIDRWAALSNSWIFWSGTQIEFMPLGDVSVTGNGVTYTPQTDVAYALNSDHFLVDSPDQPPVKVSRKDPADCYNRTTLSFTDRTRGYVSNTAEYKDQALIDTPGIGQRDATSIQADDVCDPAVADVIVQLAGKRMAYIRNTYSFTLPYRFVRCLPGTVLTLTEPNIGLDAVRVRVTRVKRDERRRLAFEAEEFPGTVGVYVAPLSTASVESPTTPNQYSAPGNINTPAIVEPDSHFTGGAARILIAASGGVNWGGCAVYLSFDGTSYSQIGTITAPASQGVLTATLAAFSGTNPDTGNTLSVDATQSQASLSPVTHDDADALRSLAMIAAQPTPSGGALLMPNDGELLAFGDLSATGTYSADLSYLQRGAYGTVAGAHAIGDQFTMINPLESDGTSISYALPSGYIGQTLYLKFASFNLFGLAVQDLSTVAEYHFVPTGRGYGAGSGGVPSTPTGLAAVATTNGIMVTWDANAVADNIAYYTLYRADGAGASFGSASAVWWGQALRYVDPDNSVSGAFTYFLTASNAAGESVPTAGIDVSVIDIIIDGQI